MEWCRETRVSALDDSGCRVLVNAFHPAGAGLPAAVPQRAIAVVVRGLLGDANLYWSDASDVVFMP